MDPQACFSPPLAGHLANQSPGVLGNGFPGRYATHLGVFGIHPHESNEKDAFSTIRYQNTTTIRRTGEDSEPADLSVTRNDSQPSNTRLLRKILQAKMSDDELATDTDDIEYVESSPLSVSVDGEDSGEDIDGKSHGPDAEVAEERTGGGVIRQAGNLLGDSHNPMRVPSNGASSENSEPSSTGSRKGKRKQIYPQQVDGVAGIAPEHDAMRDQLNDIQEQINVFQERYNIRLADGENCAHRVGQKRKYNNDDHRSIEDGIDALTTNGALGLLTSGVHRMSDQLATLISTEIHEKIIPIIESVIKKYVPPGASPAKSDQSISHPQSQKDAQQRDTSRQRSKTPSPIGIRSEALHAPSPTHLLNGKKHLDKPLKQPLNVNNDAQIAGKNFGPINRHFAALPFFGNENKFNSDLFNITQLAAMANAPTMMYNHNFPHPLLRPNFLPAEQTEAIPLVVSQKKKRHKVTDTRNTPRVLSKMMGQKEESQDSRKFGPVSPGPMGNAMLGFNGNGISYVHGLNHSDFSPFHTGMDNGRYACGLAASPFFNRANTVERREASSPLGGSAGSPTDNDEVSLDEGSEIGSADMSIGGMRQPRDFSQADSMTYPCSSTLTPMHLRKAKLMFFYTRYPNSATLKTFFPDIKFNKNNTAQLVKWFSNFREFYYIQMEKHAKHALDAGVKDAEQIEVSKDSDLYRALNQHYNRNNHIEVPEAFRDVVEATLQEFFKALQAHRDNEPSWKKAIYKVINRMDDVIPDYFRLPQFLEQLE